MVYHNRHCNWLHYYIANVNQLEQQENMYLWQKYCNMFLSSFRIVTDPFTNGLKDNALSLHIEFIVVKDVTEFLHSQLKELLTGNNFFKVIQDDLECLLLQLGAVVGVAEPPDDKAVVSREHLHQEVKTSLHNAHDVELVCC